jgi:hypothetical protein
MEKSMHGLVKLGLAAALLAGATSVSLAETAATKPAASEATTATTDATTTASIGTNFNSLLGGINAGTEVDLTRLTAVPNIKFVAIDTLQGWDMKKFDDAVPGTADMTSLRGKIGANATLKSKLEGAGHTVDDVVWIEKGADGSFTVYVDDRA